MKIIGSLALLIMLMMPKSVQKIVNDNAHEAEIQQSSSSISSEGRELRFFEKKEPLVSIEQALQATEKVTPGWNAKIDEAWDAFELQNYPANRSSLYKFLPTSWRRYYTMSDLVHFMSDDNNVSEPAQRDLAEIVKIIKAYPTYFPEFAHETREQILQHKFSDNEMKYLFKRVIIGITDFSYKFMLGGLQALGEWASGDDRASETFENATQNLEKIVNSSEDEA